MYHRLRNRFGYTQWYFKVMRLKWKLNSVCLEIELVLAQDRCTVCAKRTIGLDIIFNAPMVLLGDEAQVEAQFGLFGDSANLDARYVHSLRRSTIGTKVVLNAPNGTPR